MKSPTSKIYDMHCHSTRSDGLKSPLELAHHAKLCGLAGIAITDHDTLPDAELWRKIAAMTGRQLITGIEISTHFAGHAFHLLGYYFDPSYPSLVAVERELVDRRRARHQFFVETLAERIPTFDPAPLNRPGAMSTPCRKHLARELVRQRFASTARRAFQRYLSGLGREAPRLAITLEHAITAIHDAGGIAILAHPPVGLSQDVWSALGATRLDGIESRYGKLSGGHRRFLQDRVEEYRWFASAGSDFHGDRAHERLGLHHIDEQHNARLRQRSREYGDHEWNADG